MLFRTASREGEGIAVQANTTYEAEAALLSLPAPWLAKPTETISVAFQDRLAQPLREE